MNEDYFPQRIIDYLTPTKVVELLESRRFVGPIYSLGVLIKGLIVPFEVAFRETSYVLKGLIGTSDIQPLTERQFAKLLEDQGVVVHPSPEHFNKLKEKKLLMAGQEKGRLRELVDAIQVSPNKLRYDADKARWIVEGRNGYLFADNVYWYVSTNARSKRHFSSIKRQLAFMELVRDGDQEGELRVERMPIEAEAPIIRKIVGLKKLPTLTEERKIALKNHANVMRGGTISESAL